MLVNHTCKLVAMGVPERLEKLLLESGVGKRQVRKEIARACKISVQAVGQWFNGSTNNPTADNLAAVAKAYHANLMWIVTGEGPMLSDVPINADESWMLNVWRRLPTSSKEKIRDRFEAAIQSLDNQDQ